MGWSELIGAVFGDDEHKYSIEAEIARGGMSRVFRAREAGNDRVVALKVMAVGSEGGGDSRTFTRRFEHEARAVERLDHPNIVKVFATGRTEDFVFIAMQLVLGGTFRQRLGKPMPVADACYQMIQMAKALHHAHAHHIIHRDVKPANMLIDDQDPSHLLLADFGIAKIIGQEGVTKTGTAVGTPEYMAPEQAKGEKIDQRADIYGLACVLYEALAGRPPFVGPTALSICYQHVHTRPAYIRGFNPEVPRALALVIEQALAKNPRDRFPTAEDFANALYPFTESTGRGLRPTTPSVMVNSTDDSEDLVPASDGGTNALEALVVAAHVTAPADQSVPANADASAMLDLSMLGTRQNPVPNLTEDATMVQTQEMTPISQPSRPRHTRPVTQPSGKLKSRPITHPRTDGSYGSSPYDALDVEHMDTRQTPIPPNATINAPPPPPDAEPTVALHAHRPQPSRTRVAIVIAVAIIIALLGVLLVNHVHAGTASAPGNSSSSTQAVVNTATVAPTAQPTAQPTTAPTNVPTQQPTATTAPGQPTATPTQGVSASLIVKATSTDSPDYDCTVNRSTLAAEAPFYINTCVTPGYGSGTVQGKLYYSNGNYTQEEYHWSYSNPSVSSHVMPFNPRPAGKYFVIVTWNGERAQTLYITFK